MELNPTSYQSLMGIDRVIRALRNRTELVFARKMESVVKTGGQQKIGHFCVS